MDLVVRIMSSDGRTLVRDTVLLAGASGADIASMAELLNRNQVRIAVRDIVEIREQYVDETMTTKSYVVVVWEVPEE